MPHIFGYTSEYQTPNGDWTLAHPGRSWKTRLGVKKAIQAYLDEASNCGWHPTMRIVELVYGDNCVVFK